MIYYDTDKKLINIKIKFIYISTQVSHLGIFVWFKESLKMERDEGRTKERGAEDKGSQEIETSMEKKEIRYRFFVK